MLLNFYYMPNLGAGNETRTRDPDLGKVVLYQLSYFRIVIVMGVQIYTHFFIPKISLIFFQQIFNLVKFHKGFNWR